MSAPLPPFTQVAVRWAGGDDVPVLAANQFAIQIGGAAAGEPPDEFYLTIGQATPPLLSGDETQQQTEREGLTEISSTVIGRFSLSRARIGELARMFGELDRTFDISNTVEEGGGQ